MNLDKKEWKNYLKKQSESFLSYYYAKEAYFDQRYLQIIKIATEYFNNTPDYFSINNIRIPCFDKNKVILDINAIHDYLATTNNLLNKALYRKYLLQEYCLKNKIKYVIIPYAIPINQVKKLIEAQVTLPQVLSVGKWFSFAYAHKLESSYLNQLENDKIFGKCNNFYSHGHNARLYVEVKGFVDPLTGMVINYNDLSRIVKEKVLEVFDHKHLNYDLKHLFEDKTTTSENTLQVIWNILKPELPILNKLIFYEAENSVSELKREDIC